jgi:hypothetical protein
VQGRRSLVVAPAVEQRLRFARFLKMLEPAWSGWIAPGRIGFMSTQRRENRPTLTTETSHPHAKEQRTLLAESGIRGPQRGWWPTGWMGRAEDFGSKCQIQTARIHHAPVSGGAARPASPAWFQPRWLATHTLQSDRCNTQLVRLVPLAIRRGSPRCAQEPFGLRLTDLPNISPLPVLRVSIHPCRGYRQR